jgi:hypothetical protein
MICRSSEIRRQILLTISAIAFLLTSAVQSLADVSIRPNGGVGDIYIFGTINKGDAEYVIKATEGEYKNKPLMVRLSSEGGDVSAAMTIRKIIRNSDSEVIVPSNSKCLSSCALIFIAGVLRTNLGLIGLHRPYFAATLSRTEIEQSAPVMLAKVRDYVRAMGVSDAFYDAMVNTEPSDIRLYYGDEIKKLVPAKDPTYDEIDNAYNARKYGVSAAEMRQRKLAAKKCEGHWADEPPPSFQKIVECEQAVYWGIDVHTSGSAMKASQNASTRPKPCRART